jgi:predicted HicB family RNase H-like nuclease
MPDKEKKSKTPAADTPKQKNVWIRAELHRRLKIRASKRGVPIQELAEEYLSWSLDAEPDEPETVRKKKRPTRGGTAPM